MIPDVYKGKPVYANDIRDLIAEVKSNRITAVVGGLFQRGIHGTTLILPQTNTSTSTGVDAIQPFTIIQAPTEPGWDQPRFYVEPESFLMKDENESVQQITPINTGYDPFELPTLPGAIFIKVEFDENMAILGAWLETGTLSTALWPNYPKPVERDDTGEDFNYLRQKYLRICIAEVVPESDKREGQSYTIGTGPSAQVRKIVQLVNTDLLLEWKILDGLAAKLATPYKRACRKTIPTP